MQSRIAVSASAKGWLHDATPSATHPVGLNVVIESVTAPPFSSCLALHRAFLVRRVAANMAAADFCPVTSEIPSAALCRFAVCCLFARLRLAACRSAWALVFQLRPFLDLRFSSTSPRPTDLPR